MTADDNKATAIVMRRYCTEEDRDKYSLIGSYGKMSDAEHAIDSYSGEVGDILMTCAIEDVTNITYAATSTYVVDDDGDVVFIEQKGNEYDDMWIEFWEGKYAKASQMMQAISGRSLGVKNDELMPICCAIVRLAYNNLRMNDEKIISALKYAENYCIDTNLRFEPSILDDAVRPTGDVLSDYVCKSLRKIKFIITDNATDRAYSAFYLASYAVSSFADEKRGEEEAQAVIRSMMPLRKVLLHIARKRKSIKQQ